MDFAIEHGILYCGWCPEAYETAKAVLTSILLDFDMSGRTIKSPEKAVSIAIIQSDQDMTGEFGNGCTMPQGKNRSI